jgi:hypothetical protein
VKDRLMDATNASAPFKVKLLAQVVTLGPSGGRAIKFTVTTPRPTYLLLLSRDSTGHVNVLLPNANILTSPHAEAGATELPPERSGWFYEVKPPYGRTSFKLIASTSQVELLGPHTADAGVDDPFDIVNGLKALTIQGTSATMRNAEDLSKLLGEDEWTTAEAELVTTPDEGATADSGRG